MLEPPRQVLPAALRRFRGALASLWVPYNTLAVCMAAAEERQAWQGQEGGAAAGGGGRGGAPV